ncbi:MAG: nucleotidyltransferase family protein [Eubacterium sp.]|nr:nucleotidyltransferase family protein [Eubacterium sp.]MDD7210373.1 nucleotidyltransferase family protein [Lachnospiraceae bacterium]MDY5496927.1 nucleotidyltransferase family protein [Anaerobutyricum sp.]
MKTAGIIAEYNPFHDGHRYHIEQTRKQTGADYVIVVMSGDYVQRGEPAIADKYTRTRMALSGGADLVIELPVVYATASAEYFATAGVKLLNDIGCVDYLSFGSEWAGEEDYVPYVDLFLNEPQDYKQYLKEGLKEGMSFPRARARAAARILKDPKAEDFLKEPNHILGIEYGKALKKLRSPMRPVTVKRAGNAYHDESLSGKYLSATAIRTALFHSLKNDEGEQKDKICELLGDDSQPFLTDFFRGEYVSWDDLMPFLDYTVLLKKKLLGKYFGMDLELARRMQNLYEPGLSFETLLERLHTRQRTDSALKRALLHICLHIKADPFLEDGGNIPVPYARILGFSQEAAPLLKKIRETAKIRLIQRAAEGKKIYEEQTSEGKLFYLDVRSSDFYEQIAARKAGRLPVSEFSKQQIIL